MISPKHLWTVFLLAPESTKRNCWSLRRWPTEQILLSWLKGTNRGWNESGSWLTIGGSRQKKRNNFLRHSRNYPRRKRGHFGISHKFSGSKSTSEPKKEVTFYFFSE
jgi:hypothetical protein